METTLKPYPNYHRIDLPWQQSAPAHWVRLRLKHLLHEVDERTQTGEEPLLSLTRSRGLVRRSEITNKPPSAKTLIGYKVCQPGDLVMNRMQAWSGMFGLASDTGLVSPDYAVLRPTEKADAGFLLNLLKSPGPVSHFAALSTGLGTGFNRLYTDQFGAIPIAAPPSEEQTLISAAIRDIERRAGRLIYAKQRLIALLDEQKHAIIQRAVTRGINLDLPLKPSGVDWLGDVPAHWDVVRARYIYREVDVRSKAGEETHLSMSQKHGLIRSSALTERAFHSASYAGGKLCEAEDLVLNRLKAHLGVFALASESGVVSPDYSVFRLHQAANPKYFEYVLRTPLIRGELKKRVRGIVEGLWRLYTPDFYDIPLPVPPVNEQEEIVEALATELSELNDAIEKTRSEIELIREYRTRLIADVVTGTLDVRGVVVPDVDDEEAGVNLELSGDDASILDGEALADASR
jgi:type I restriction enzyme, S subunit